MPPRTSIFVVGLAIGLLSLVCGSSAHAQDTEKLYAPPLAYGPSVKLRAHLGASTYKIVLKQVGNVPTQVTGAVTYWKTRDKQVTETFVGTITIRTADVVGQPELKVKATPTGTFVDAHINR